MPVECRSCGRVEEQRLRRPPDCPTKDLCDLRAVQISRSVESPVLPRTADSLVSPVNAELVVDMPCGSRTALERFSEIAGIARAGLAAVVARDEAELRTAPNAGVEIASGVPPAPTAALLIGDERFELRADMLLGRNGNVGFAQMRSDATVSREHARVRCRDGHWSIENVARSNNVLRVGDRSIGFGASCELGPGHNAIVLGERFEVRIVIG